jgi:hypothetical protein
MNLPFGFGAAAGAPVPAAVAAAPVVDASAILMSNTNFCKEGAVG